MSRQPRLLIVDDEPVHRAFASIALGSAGWLVDEAANGGVALCAIKAMRYAVVLLDIGMPGIDGYETARLIRDGGSADPLVPILAFTSLSGPDLARRVERAGMDGTIAKPIPAAALIARLAPFGSQSASPARARLAAIFGVGEMAALVDSFRSQLAEALAAIDAPGGAALAHRIAGIAGTLGFPEVHRTWLALSEDEAGSRGAAASAARLTLRMLADTTL